MVSAHAQMHPCGTSSHAHSRKHDLSLCLIFMSLQYMYNIVSLVLGLLLFFLFETHARIHRLTDQWGKWFTTIFISVLCITIHYNSFGKHDDCAEANSIYALLKKLLALLVISSIKTQTGTKIWLCSKLTISMFIHTSKQYKFSLICHAYQKYTFVHLLSN